MERRDVHPGQCWADATNRAGRVAMAVGSVVAVITACSDPGGSVPTDSSSGDEGPPAAALEKTSGDGQQGGSGMQLPAPLVVTAVDSSGGPVTGVPVRFRASAGRVAPATGETDADGRRRVRLTLPDREGVVTVTASSQGLAEVEFEAEAVSDGDGASPDFPISVSGRYIIDADGDVVILNGATPWSLAVQLDSAEVETYLDARAAQGVNAILFNAIEHLYADAPPENVYGDRPFTGTLPGGEADFTALHEGYWSHVEWIVAEARERGMVCLVAPAYIGFQFGPDGWAAELEANGPDRIRTYGEALGDRLGSHGNVVWVMGGDWGPTHEGTDLTAEVGAMVAGIEASSPGAVFTGHGDRHESALDVYDEPWLDVNNTYSDPQQGAAELEEDYRRTDGAGEAAMPSFWIEGYYENEHDMTAVELRSQMYWSLLGGAAGHLYGVHPVWPFEAQPAQRFGDSFSPPYDTWKNALDTEVAGDLRHVRRLIDTRPLEQMEPDWEEGVVTSGRESGTRYAAAARARDGSLILAYLPSRRTVTVDMSRITVGDTAGVSWVDPRTGDTTSVGDFATSGSRDFTPPAEGDWLLVVENAASAP